jgi:hypothetical protein
VTAEEAWRLRELVLRGRALTDAAITDVRRRLSEGRARDEEVSERLSDADAAELAALLRRLARTRALELEALAMLNAVLGPAQ